MASSRFSGASQGPILEWNLIDPLTRVGMTIYLVFAGLVYGWTALALAESDPPETMRDAIGAALACGAVAAMWPVVVSWRLLVRPLPVA